MYEIGKVMHNWIDANGSGVKIEDEQKCLLLWVGIVFTTSRFVLHFVLSARQCQMCLMCPNPII